MDPTHSQVYSDKFQSFFAPSYDSQDDILSSLSSGQIAENSSQNENARYVNYGVQSYQQVHIPLPVQPTITQFIPPTQFTATQLQQISIPPPHPTAFFYRPLNDFCHYYVNCKNISYDNVAHLLNISKEQNIQSNENECIFYHKQQYNDQFYQISCEIVSPILISNCLNEKYGIDLRYEDTDEHLTFKLYQKENLELRLNQYLSQYSLN